MSDATSHPPTTTTAPPGESAAAARAPEFDATVAFAQEHHRDSTLEESLNQLPSYISRGLIYLILGFLASALTYAVLVPFPVIRSARAEIVPEGYLQQIQADCDGILSRIAVREGDSVNAGDVVAEIDSRDVVVQVANLRQAQQKFETAKREQTDLIPLRRTQIESQREVLRHKQHALAQTKRDLVRQQADRERSETLARATRELEQLKEKEAIAQGDIDVTSATTRKVLKKDEFTVADGLKKKGGVSDLQWRTLNSELKLAEAEEERARSRLAEARQSQEIAARKFASLELEFRQTEADLREQLEQNEISLRSVEEELEQKKRELKILEFDAGETLRESEFQFRQARETLQVSFPGIGDDELERLLNGTERISSRTLIRAPRAGSIAEVLVRNTGENVTRGKSLMSLIPQPGRFRAEIRIANRDVGLMATDTEVRLKLDAFPHVEHGVLKGVLEEIIAEGEGTEPGGESYFRGYASLNQQEFEAHGRTWPLMSGMMATAEIITEYQTIAQMLLRPLLEATTEPRSAKTPRSKSPPREATD